MALSLEISQQAEDDQLPPTKLSHSFPNLTRINTISLQDQNDFRILVIGQHRHRGVLVDHPTISLRLAIRLLA
jgi:hypothetical protein